MYLTTDDAVAIWGLSSLALLVLSGVACALGGIWGVDVFWLKLFASAACISFVSLMLAVMVTQANRA